MKAFVARFLDVRAGLMKGNTRYESGVIKMGVRLSKCSCLSPDDFKDLSSKEREGTHITCTHTSTELSVSIRIYVVNPKQVINWLRL